MMMSDKLDRLRKLTKEKQLVFGLLAAERFFKCYKIFSQREDFGNIIILLESMSLVESIALGQKINSELIKEKAGEVDKNIPDIDDFGSVNSSLALNVGCIIFETLNLIISNEDRLLSDISTYCTDSIDAIIFEIEEYDQRELEKIFNHNLMKEEIRLQEGIVSYLEKISDVEAGDIEALRHMQTETEFSQLNLERIFAD